MVSDDALAWRPRGKRCLPNRRVVAADGFYVRSPCLRTPCGAEPLIPDWGTIAAIFAGGAVGTLARAGLAQAFPHAATAWPWATFAVNVVAAFLLGYFVTMLTERRPPSRYRRPLLGTGLCG